MPSHSIVHEARLADARAPVEREKVSDPRLDVGGRAHGRGASIGGVAFETSHLSLELVAVFSGKAGEVGLPGGWQGEHGTSFFHRGGRFETASGRERRQRADRGRHLGHGVQRPLDLLRRPGLKESHPRLLLPPLDRNQIEIVGNVGTPDDLQGAGRRFVERQERHEVSAAVLNAPDLEAVAVGKRARPLALPRPGEKRRSQTGGRDEPVPRGSPYRFQPVTDRDFH